MSWFVCLFPSFLIGEYLLMNLFIRRALYPNQDWLQLRSRQGIEINKYQTKQVLMYLQPYYSVSIYLLTLSITPLTPSLYYSVQSWFPCLSFSSLLLVSSQIQSHSKTTTMKSISPLLLSQKLSPSSATVISPTATEWAISQRLLRPQRTTSWWSI